MQLRSTTPVSLIRANIRFVMFAAAMSMLSIIVLATAGSAESNSDRQKRIDELTAQINQNVSKSRELNTQSGSINSQIDALRREEQYLKNEISKNETDQQVVEDQIKDNESRLVSARAALGQVMADMYVSGTITPLEMLASSGSVANYIDAETYQKAAQDQLAGMIQSVQKLENELEAKQAKLKRIAGDQINQKKAIALQQETQASMLTATTSQSGELEKVTAEKAAERKALQTEQQSMVAASMSGAEQVTPGTISQPVESASVVVRPAPAPTESQQNSTPAATPTAPVQAPPAPQPAVVLPNGGYPSYLNGCYVDANALSYGIDPWGYGCRQCVSYTAWKVLQKTGNPARYWGNANQWPSSARRVGYQTGSSPRAGSVGVMMNGPYGHVAWIESVNSNGTVNVSQYNYWLPNKPNGGWGWYSEFRNVSSSTYQVYIYI